MSKIEKRCKKCTRLLFMQVGNIKQIKTTDRIIYSISGNIEITCKCGTINNF
jgi:RNase P subunit RPR2